MTSNRTKEASYLFEKTLISEDLKDVTIEITESLMDRSLDDNIFKDIPVIRTVVGLAKTASNVQEMLFLKKIVYFLVEINSISNKERELMINKINSSKEYKLRVGEKILYIIDKADDHETTQLVAKLFSAFLQKKIEYADFLHGSTIINNVFIEDLYFFLNNKKFLIDDVGGLIGSGLFDINVIPIEAYVEDQDDWKLNEKYKTNISGGDIQVEISHIGKIIKSILGN